MRNIKRWLGVAATVAALLPVSAVHAEACVAGTSTFSDVPDAATYCSSTQWMKRRAITVGCSGTSYCPDAVVTRGAMALFMNRLGNVLSPVVVRKQATQANFIPGNVAGNRVCTTDNLAAVDYPRIATISGFLSVAAPSATMTVRGAAVMAIDSAAFSTPTQYVSAALPMDAAATLPATGVFPIPAGHSASFAMTTFQTDAGSGATVAAMTCDVIVQVSHQGLADVSASASAPADPVIVTPNTAVSMASPGAINYVYVPAAYDATHATPMSLLVWLHGCGGIAANEIYNVAPGSGQHYIAMAVGGADGSCWNEGTDMPKVLGAVAAIKTHFNIKPKGVVLSGYSSGGDIGYPLMFRNSLTFAAFLGINTAPFMSGASHAATLALATWKFPVVQMVHTSDQAYPPAVMAANAKEMVAAGFNVNVIERPGTHFDNPGTIDDLRNVLLPYMNVAWASP